MCYPDRRTQQFDPAGLANSLVETNSCEGCAFSRSCLSMGYELQELAALHSRIEPVGPYEAGEYLFRLSDPLHALYAVRSGAVKTRAIDKRGRERVLGFYLPGEVVGLTAIHPKRFLCDAILLEASQFYRLPFPEVSHLAARIPVVQQHLLVLIGKELGVVNQLAADSSADERMATFLSDLSRRHIACGFSGTQFRLHMSRSDMASHLRLATETVSRVLGRLCKRGLIRVEGRMLTILDVGGLSALGRRLLVRQ